MAKLAYNQKVRREIAMLMILVLLICWLCVQGIYWYFDPEVSGAFRMFIGLVFFFSDFLLIALCIGIAIDTYDPDHEVSEEEGILMQLLKGER